jgi:hypothetical protein
MESDKSENSTRNRETTIQVEIASARPVLTRGGGSTTFFVPHADQREPTPTSSYEETELRRNTPAPEKKLTLFALRLAVLEKAASGLGTLAFILATVSCPSKIAKRFSLLQCF